MKLADFSITGDAVVDEAGAPDVHGDLPLVDPGDPTRKIARFKDTERVSVTVRLNHDLLRIARDLPLIVCRLAPTDRFPPEDTMNADERSLQREWIEKGLSFYWELPDAIKGANTHACHLADQFGPGVARVYYFAAEDPTQCLKVVEAGARASGFGFEGEQSELRRAAHHFLPIELIGHLGVAGNGSGPRVRVGFGFTGSEESLALLRPRLEREGHRFEELITYLGELRTSKEVPVDPDGFLRELQTIVPLSRALNCSYTGEETVAGRSNSTCARRSPSAIRAARSRSSPGCSGARRLECPTSARSSSWRPSACRWC